MLLAAYLSPPHSALLTLPPLLVLLGFVGLTPMVSECVSACHPPVLSLVSLKQFVQVAVLVDDSRLVPTEENIAARITRGHLIQKRKRKLPPVAWPAVASCEKRTAHTHNLMPRTTACGQPGAFPRWAGRECLFSQCLASGAVMLM